jgi:glycosyltransferase involved in cell wall biosynthesis
MPESDVHFRPLFAPGAAIRSPSGIAARAFAFARSAAKRLPAAYALADAARAAALVAEQRRGLTVYHETNHAAPPFSGPVVLTIHDLSTLIVPQTEEPARVRHFAPALRLHARHAARVITPTKAIAAQVVERLGVSADRVRAIPHGVSERFNPEGATASPVPGKYVLYVGALGPRKGVDTLLAAWRALPQGVREEHALVLAGPLQRLDPTGLEDAVLLGYVRDDELPPLLRGATAFCYPSRYEGFGLPLLEALACAVPSVASDDPALVEVAGGAALHFARGDVEALSHALSRIIDDTQLRISLIRKGPARAAEFTWQRSANAHLAAYRESAR